MNIGRRIIPIAVKEFRQVSRDTRTLGILLFVPAFMLVMYGYALTFDVKHVPLAVLDQNKTPASRALIEKFRHTEYFDLLYNLTRSREIGIYMEEEKIHAALVIPVDFSERVLGGRTAEVQVIVDGANSNEANAAVGYVNAILLSYTQNVFAESFLRLAGNVPVLPIDLRPRIWFNPELKSAKFLFPGLIGFLLMVTTVISTALSIVREKEQGTMEQIVVSPIRSRELIIGKTIPYILSSLISAVVILLVGYIIFDLTVRGSLLLLLLVTFIYILGGLGLGILISTVAKTQQVAFFLAIMITMLPSFLLSGFIFPIKNMPVPIQVVTYIIPARYYLSAMRGIILKGVGVWAFWDQIVLLCIFTAVIMGISSLRLTRQRL